MKLLIIILLLLLLSGAVTKQYNLVLAYEHHQAIIAYSRQSNCRPRRSNSSLHPVW